MKYDFDQVIERRNTLSLKYDFAQKIGKPEDVLPLWVADMDFQAPPPVLEELHKLTDHGIFGYSETKDDYFEVLRSWFARRHRWEIENSWLVKTPGVVYAICTAIRALTERGDAVLIQTPVYYPFAESIKANSRKLVCSSLLYRDGRYSMDFADFEAKIKENQVKLFILCSPHNPVGRVWTREELVRMGEICRENHVIVVADEIHQDLIYPGHEHLVFAGLHPSFLEFTLTCTAPSKTFNLAGLQSSNIFIPNEKIRRAFQREMNAGGYSQMNIYALRACMAAYSHGEAWLEDLKSYLQGNLAFIRDFLAAHLPMLKLIEPEGTYLVWLDCRKLGLSGRDLDDFIVHKAKLWLDDGAMFGPEGSGFQRFNIACPRSTLEQAFLQLKQAVDSL